MQSKSELLRKVFIRPKELDLAPNELVKVLRPVYGLADAGEYWSETLSSHLREHFQFRQSVTDLSLWLRTTADKIVALAATYVDDVLMAATPSALADFKSISSKRFDITFVENDELQYLGIRIHRLQDGIRTVPQPKKIDRLQLLSLSANFLQYRPARASMAWLQQTRPDIYCAISFAARTTETTYGQDSIRSYNSAVHYLRNTRDVALIFPKLDATSLRLVCHIDSGH